MALTKMGVKRALNGFLKMGVTCSDVWAVGRSRGRPLARRRGEGFPGSNDPKLEGGSCHHDRRGILQYGLRAQKSPLKKKKKKQKKP